MTFYYRGIVICGLAGVLLAGAWFTAVGVTLGIPPHAAAKTPATFTAAIDGRLYHADLHCPHNDASKPQLPFATQEAAERFGYACPHCVTGQLRVSRSP